MLDTQINFLNFVNDEFKNRKKKNPRYSLRSYAKSLNADPSLLSKIIRNKYKINEEIIRELAEPLGLSEVQIQQFIQINTSDIENQKFFSMDDDVVSAISDWTYFVIIRLIDISPELNPKKIAVQLNTSESDIQNKINLLEKLGVLEKIGTHKYKRIREQILIKPTDKSPQANRDLIKQFLDQAQKSVEQINYSKRTHASSIFAIKQSSLPKFQKRMHEFLIDLSKLAHEDKDSNDAVYNVMVNLHPLYTEEHIQNENV